MVNKINWASARDRLESLDDAATLAAFDATRPSGDLNSAFLAIAMERSISLDWLLYGYGGPFVMGEQVKRP